MMQPSGTARAQLGESPAWSAVERAVYWVDVRARTLFRTRPDTGRTDLFKTPEQASAVVVRREGGVLLAGETALFTTRDGRRWDTLGGPPGHPADHRFNDATLDPVGRLIIGTTACTPVKGPTGRLYSYHDGNWHVLAEGFRTLNGLAFSTDGTTLYLSDSHPDSQLVWRMRYDVTTGRASARAPFFDMRGIPGRPDGAAMATDGIYWIAAVGAARLYGLDRAGMLCAEIALPVERPTKPCFGGPDMTTMFVSSMAINLEQPDPQGWAGALLTGKAPAPGMALTPFAG